MCEGLIYHLFGFIFYIYTKHCLFFFCHKQILECAVVVVPDEVLGEKVLAILVLRHGDKGAAAGEYSLFI